MSIFTELKNFMMRGNVVDMAVGVIVGGAFGKIVTSLVSDIVMPPIGFILGGVDFSDLKLVIKDAAEGAAAVTINYGSFIQTIINFVIIGTAIFFVIKGMNALNIKTQNEAAAPSKEESLLTEIRDLLKEQNKK